MNSIQKIPAIGKPFWLLKKDSLENQKPSEKAAFRIAWSNARQVIDKTSLHGIQSISSEKVFWLMKLVWVLCLAVSWSYFIYVAYNTVVLYESYPKVTQIIKASEPTVDFPAVDICAINAYDGGTIGNYMEYVQENRSISTATSSTLKEYIQTSDSLLKSMFDYDWHRGWFRTYDFGFWLTQLLVSCEFDGKTCSTSDFYWYHDYYYGNCFTFNGGSDLANQSLSDYEYVSYPAKKSIKTGWRNGLRLELYSGSQIYQMQFAYKTGFRVIVHNQSVVSFPDQDGIDTPAGTATNIGLKRKFLSRLPSPYSNCIDQLTEDVAKQNEILAIMYEKKQSNEIKQYQANYCMGICYQKFIVKKCDCSSSSLGRLNLTFYNSNGAKASGCYESSEINCIITSEKEFYNSEAVNQCYSLCPNECTVVSYDLKINQAGFSTKWYSDMNDQYNGPFSLWQFDADCTTYDCIRQSATVLNIFYEGKDYTVIQETPQFTIDYLVGNLGGNLSLFSGMSFLTFAEVLELMLTFMLTYIGYKFMIKNN